MYTICLKYKWSYPAPNPEKDRMTDDSVRGGGARGQMTAATMYGGDGWLSESVWEKRMTVQLIFDREEEEVHLSHELTREFHHGWTGSRSGRKTGFRNLQNKTNDVTAGRYIKNLMKLFTTLCRQWQGYIKPQTSVVGGRGTDFVTSGVDSWMTFVTRIFECLHGLRFVTSVTCVTVSTCDWCHVHMRWCHMCCPMA